MKKVWSILLVSVIGFVSCDHSSYESLPYETGGYQAPNSYAPPQPQPYGYAPYDDYGEEDFDIGEMIQTPFKALKGAGDYMKGKFDDLKSKLDEIKGSLLVAKGTFLKSHGENILIKAYKGKSKPYDYYEAPFEYYPPPSYSHPPPAPYQPPIQPYQPPVDAYQAPVDHYAGRSSESVHGEQKFGGLGFDILSGFRGSRHNEVNNNVDSVEPQRRDFVEQRSARSHGFNYPGRTQRDYSVAVEEDLRPIPVPVPIRVQPSRLVFPVFQQEYGYH